MARAPFVAAVLAILAVGLIGLLGLNTALAQDSFRLHRLQVSNKDLADREQVLRAEVDRLQAPAALAALAQAQGMVPGGPPVFLRLPDGVVLGEPVPAAAAPAGTQPAGPDVPRPDAPAALTAQPPAGKPSAVQPPAVQPPAVQPSAVPPAVQPSTVKPSAVKPSVTPSPRATP